MGHAKHRRHAIALLAHAHVRPLVEAECRDVREAAERVALTAEGSHADSEAIHDYRVALRRLRTLLAAAAPLFKRKPLARVRDGLRALAHTAGAVRDEEVLVETLAELELPEQTRAHLDAWLEGRARRERKLRRAVITHLSSGPLAPESSEPTAPSELAALAAGPAVSGAPPTAPSELSALAAGPAVSGAPAETGAPAGSVPGGSGPAVSAETPAPAMSAETPAPAASVETAGAERPPPLGRLLALVETLPLRRKASAVSTRALAIEALQAAEGKAIEEAGRADADTPAGRHRLRIRWKRVRYTGELFGKVLVREGADAEAVSALVKTATRMQKRLGELHDIDEAIARVARARALSRGDRMVVHHRLREGRKALTDRLASELPAALDMLRGQG